MMLVFNRSRTLLAALDGCEQSAYEEAVRQRYLWHEFGDLNLIV